MEDGNDFGDWEYKQHQYLMYLENKIGMNQEMFKWTCAQSAPIFR